MIFQVFDDGGFCVGVIGADSEEEARTKARTKNPKATVREVRYRNEVDCDRDEDTMSYTMTWTDDGLLHRILGGRHQASADGGVCWFG